MHHVLRIRLTWLKQNAHRVDESHNLLLVIQVVVSSNPVQ